MLLFLIQTSTLLFQDSITTRFHPRPEALVALSLPLYAPAQALRSTQLFSFLGPALVPSLSKVSPLCHHEHPTVLPSHDSRCFPRELLPVPQIKAISSLLPPDAPVLLITSSADRAWEWGVHRGLSMEGNSR